MTVRLSDVRAANGRWFSPMNKRLFGDVSYRLLHGKRTHKPYLVRSTYQWSDMFGRTRTLSYRVNEINPDLTIGKLLDDTFDNLDEVKDWMLSA